MTSLSTWALMKIDGPTPAVMTLSPAKYSSAAHESAGPVTSRDGRSGIEKTDTAVLKFSAHGILPLSERTDGTERKSTAKTELVVVEEQRAVSRTG